MFLVVIVGFVVIGALPAGPVAAAPQPSVPATCVEHRGWAGEPDVPGDERCAGLAIDFHTSGVAASPGPIWAGQWLFVDEAGLFRVGSCAFNRGVHPTTAVASSPVQQALPNDPSGDKAAYLTWRYGDTDDPLTAAAMWAVMHFYAQDAAGSRRSIDADAPLVDSLDRVAAMSGRADLQVAAVALDAEARRFAPPWVLDLRVEPGTVSVAVRAGDAGVPGVVVALDVGGAAMGLTTDEVGRASVAVTFDPGSTSVLATGDAPGRALAYRGQPAWADPQGAQILVTGGAPRVLRAAAIMDVPVVVVDSTTTTSSTEAPTTTTTTAAAPPVESSSTLAAPPTEVSTTTEMTTSTEVSTTTGLPTSVPTATAGPPAAEAPTSAAPPAPVAVHVVPPSTTAPAPPSSPASVPPGPSSVVTRPITPELPRTGATGRLPAYLGTSLLVAGVGLLGTVRRRVPRSPEPYFDVDG